MIDTLRTKIGRRLLIAFLVLALIPLIAAAFPGDGAEARELIHKADQALYAAKRAGRNQVSGT